MHKTDLYIIKKKIFGETLNDAERQRFDQEIAQNIEFQKTFAAYQHTNLVIRRTARQEMREKLTYFEKTGVLTQKEEKPNSIFSILRGGNRRVVIGIAASITLLVSWAIWYFQKPTISFDAVADKTQYRSFNYLNLATVRSKQTLPKSIEKTPFDEDIAYLTARYGAENTQKLSLAMTNLKDKKYAQAATLLSDLAFVTDNDSMRLSRADAYLGANDIEKAIEDYKTIVQNQTTPYRDIRMIAEWHLALAYLKKGDRDESRRRIDSIAQTTGHSFQNEAKDALKMW